MNQRNQMKHKILLHHYGLYAFEFEYFKQTPTWEGYPVIVAPIYNKDLSIQRFRSYLNAPFMTDNDYFVEIEEEDIVCLLLRGLIEKKESDIYNYTEKLH